MNGSAQRRLKSWIESFVDYTGKFLTTSEQFRRWTAISAVAAVLERKVWADLSKPLYPNLYIFLVGKAGIGKTRAIDAMMEILRDIPDFKFSPTSVTRASLTDCLVDAKRSDPDWTAGTMYEYHALYVAVDELQSLMSSWNEELVAGLTKFYDGNHYSEARRTTSLFIEINKPNLNVICGTTPSHLMNLVPEKAWEQGLMSRVIMVFSDEKIRKSILDLPEIEGDETDLSHDIRVIHKEARGPVIWTPGYKEAHDEWCEKDNADGPTHPRLEDYKSRREAHLVKLSMVSCVDRGEMVMTTEDFVRARKWLLDNELNMHGVFTAGATTIDDKAFDEIEEFVRRQGKPVQHHKIMRFAGQYIPAHSLGRVIQLMIEQRRLRIGPYDEKHKQATYVAGLYVVES